MSRAAKNNADERTYLERARRGTEVKNILERLPVVRPLAFALEAMTQELTELVEKLFDVRGRLFAVARRQLAIVDL